MSQQASPTVVRCVLPALLTRAYTRLEPDDENHQVRFLGEGAAAMPFPYPPPSRKIMTLNHFFPMLPFRDKRH